MNRNRSLLRRAAPAAFLCCIACGAWAGPEGNSAAERTATAVPPGRGHIQTEREDTIAQIDLRDINVGEALRLLTDQSGLNVMASEKAARIKTALFLRNVKPRDVLDALAKAYNLWYEEDPRSHIIRVYTVDEFRMGQTEQSYDHTEIFSVLHARATDVAYTIRDLFGGRVRLAFGSNQQEVLQELQQRFQRFNLIDGQTLGIGGTNTNRGGGNQQNSGSGNQQGFGGGYGSGQQNSGGGFGAQQGGLQSLQQIVRDQMPSIQQLRDAGAVGERQLAGSEQQSEETALETLQRVSPIYVSVVRSQNRLLVRTSDPEAMAQIRDMVSRLDVQISSLLLEVKVLSVDLSDGMDAVFNFDAFTTGDTELGVHLSPGRVITPQESVLSINVNNEFSARLRVLQDQGRVTALATPMLLTSNQEVSRVFVGEQIPVITGFTNATNSTVVAGSGTTVVNTAILPQTELRPIGTTLLLTPSINADRTVSIRVIVEQSTPSGHIVEYPVASDGEIFALPAETITSRTFSGTVEAMDDTAVAVGGLIEDRLTDQISKIPVLGDIPLLGALFRDTEKERERRELIIVLKPHVMLTPSESAEQSRRFLEGESVHPKAGEAGIPGGLDLYENRDASHNGYRVAPDYDPGSLEQHD